MNVLVTGGCGYIGSHVVQALRGAGRRITVFDNLSTGRRRAVLQHELRVGDLGDPEALDAVFADGRFAAVIHLAASVSAPQSVEHPIDYYANNAGGTLNLLRCCSRHAVRYFLYSSSAAVYGPVSGSAPVSEETPVNPLSPYGWSKWMGERMLVDAAARHGLRYAVLRYCNAAGADPEGRLGQSPDSPHLIQLACRTALDGHAGHGITIFGSDYDTRDGTCIRDYVHVTDLAAMHVQVLNRLLAGHESLVLNCGYGRGYSVREIIEVVRGVTGSELPAHEGRRRPGDPPALVADVGRMRRLLAWRPQYDDIEKIVDHAWRWEKKLQAGAWSAA